MKTVKLDLTGCKYGFDLHLRIKKAFNLPDYYGCNWGAFHDMLRGEIDAELVEIYGESTLSDEWTEQLQIMHQLMDIEKDNCARYGETFDYVVIS